ncbi:MAG: hypothetical protein ACOYD4_11650 [Solirubrobacterales bacterium]
MTEEIVDLAQQAVEGVTYSGNNWAAIIMLIGLLGFLAIAWMVASRSMRERSARFAAREKQNRADEIERIAEIKSDFESQLERERITQEFVARMNDRYDATLNRVTEAFGENSAVLRQAKDEIRRNSEAMDRNTSLLEKFVPRLPKTNGERKPVVNE